MGFLVLGLETALSGNAVDFSGISGTTLQNSGLALIRDIYLPWLLRHFYQRETSHWVLVLDVETVK